MTIIWVSNTTAWYIGVISRNPWLGTWIRQCHRISKYRCPFVVVILGPVLQQGFNWHNTSSWASPPSITEFNDYSLLDLTQLPSSWLPASLRPMHLQPKTYWSSICHVFDQQLTFPSPNMAPPRTTLQMCHLLHQWGSRYGHPHVMDWWWSDELDFQEELLSWALMGQNVKNLEWEKQARLKSHVVNSN